MKRLRLPTLAVFLAASPAFAQLLVPAADRLADYRNWFAGFDPAAGLIAPALGTPDTAEGNSPDRAWSGWRRNAPVGLIGPIVGSTYDLHCEVVFLGQTGGAWRAFGYRQSGVEHSLCEDTGALPFGSYILPPLANLETLDFYIERADGARYYAFDKSLNTAPAADGFFGVITPLTTCRSDGLGDEDGTLPFTVLAFVPEAGGTAPAEAFVLALRAGFDATGVPPVPEPATYGLAAAALLAALGLRRRLRPSRPAGS